MPPLLLGRIPECVEYLLRCCTRELSDIRDSSGSVQLEKALSVLDCLKREHTRIADPGTIPWYPLTRNPRSLSRRVDKLYEAWRRLTLFGSGVDSFRSKKVCEEFDKVMSDIRQRWVRPADQTGWLFCGGSHTGKGNYPSVLAFPLICLGPEGAEHGGVGYMRAIPSRHAPYWDFSGFARREHNLDQLDGLGRLAVSLVSGVPAHQIPHHELERLRGEFEYRILYDAPIGEGLSHTGATLLLFVLSYLRARLGSEGPRLVRFSSDHVVSCEVSPGGRIQPVTGIALKLDALLDQWGPGIHAVLGEPNKGQVDQWKKKCGLASVPFGESIQYVSNADDLVTAILGPLDDARRAFWTQVDGVEFDQIWKTRLPADLMTQVLDWRKRLGAVGDLTNRPLRVGNSPLLVRSVRARDTASVQLAFNQGAFDTTDLSLSRAILLILSGCPEFRDNADQVLWAQRQNSKYPLAPEMVYEILAAIYADGNNPGTTTYVHFLSDAEPAFSTRESLTVEDIAQPLQARRQARQVDARGCFFTPVLDYWRRQGGQHDCLDAYVISNAEIPDLTDEAEDGLIPGINSVQRVIVGRDAIRTWLRSRDEDTAIALDFDENIGSLSSSESGRLRGIFGSLPQRLVQADLVLGRRCPRWWHSPCDHSWTLHQQDAGGRAQFVLRAHFDAGQTRVTSTSVLFSTYDATPTVGLRVEIESADDDKAQRQTAHMDQWGFTSGKIPESGRPGCEGKLTPEEQSRLETRHWCSHCQAAGRHAGHISCRHRGHRIAVATIDEFVRENIQVHKGVFAVCAEQGTWRWGPASVSLDDVSVVLCDGNLLVVGADGDVSSPGEVNDAFETICGATKWILFKVK